jgi:signal transduction histidine kinase
MIVGRRDLRGLSTVERRVSEMRWSPAVSRTAVAGGVGLLVTVAVVVLPSVRFAYRSTAGHLVLETAVTLVAGLVALLLYGRYRRSGALGELLLVYSLSMLALTALFFVTLPGLLGQEAGVTASSWAALVVRLVGALLLLAAALVPAGTVHRVARLRREAAGVALGVVVIGVTTLALSSALPDAVAVRVLAEQSGRPSFDGHAGVLVVQFVDLVCYAVAAVVFTRRSAEHGDDLLGWFGAAFALGATARLSYLLFPSLYTDWLYVGDVQRLWMYLLLLVGAVLEIRHYWEAQAALAVQSERRRLARDLHDGVVQELGYIRSESKRSGHPMAEADVVTRIGAAADRALDEARRAINALVVNPDDGLAAAVKRATCEVGDRYDVPVTLHLDESVEVGLDMREALVRIAREAVANAARHARTPTIAVTLSHGCLEVADRGRGFDPSRGRVGGFGLTSMRERAAAIDAAVLVESSPGDGTRVRVSW